MKRCLVVDTLYSSLVLVLCLTTIFGVPLRTNSYWILVIFLMSMVFGARRFLKIHFRLRSVLPVILASIGIAIAVGLKSFQGCFPSITPDTWGYASFGQYLTDYSRGDHVALPLIDQFSATLSGTRFGASSLLGFLSVVLHINTARALLPALFIVLANGFFGYYSVSRLLGIGNLIAFGSGMYFVLCGWTSDAQKP